MKYLRQRCNNHSIISESGQLLTIYRCISCNQVKSSIEEFDTECIYYLITKGISSGKSDREIAFELDIDDDEVAHIRHIR